MKKAVSYVKTENNEIHYEHQRFLSHLKPEFDGFSAKGHAAEKSGLLNFLRAHDFG